MIPDPDGPVAALAADLRAVGYTSDALREAWGEIGDQALARGLRGPALQALAGRSDALAVLARLLGLGYPQPVADVDAALAATAVDGLCALGLAVRVGAEVVPAALVRPQAFADDDGDGEWWIASDLDESVLGDALPENHVLGVGGASQTLARLQLAAASSRDGSLSTSASSRDGSLSTGAGGVCLDLGTGCGIQALRLRRGGAERVVATDVSERALRYTELNASLNDVDGIETRRGSLYEPVDGERFARIVSNPPFVITPRVDGVPAYEYRDGGRVGDDLVAEVVRGAGERLAPGGVLQSLGNWEYRDGDDGLERVRSWVAASQVPVDAWVVERERLDPLAYAELWVRDGGTVPGTPAYARLVGAWLDDFAARGVTAVGFGYVLLHRPPSGTVTLERYERIEGSAAVAGAHLAAALAAHARLVALDDAGLAASRLVVAADVTEARHHRPGDDAPTVIELRQGDGFARVLPVDPALAGLVGACDGDLAVGPLAEAVAELLEVDAAALRADLLPRVRELIFTGFLRFAA